MTVDQAMAFKQEQSRSKKNQQEKIRKLTERIKEFEKQFKDLQKQRTREHQEGREPARWTAEESLSFKIHNLLSDRDFQNIRNSFATVQPLSETKKLFEKLTDHVKLEDIKSGSTTVGYRTTLKDVLSDAIRTGNLGIKPDITNDLKLTGDGGRLSPKYPMTCIFVQSLSMTENQQGLFSASPLSIVTSQESYEVLKMAMEGYKEEMKDLERKGLKLDGKTYKFMFYFCADLKFMWLVRLSSSAVHHKQVAKPNVHSQLQALGMKTGGDNRCPYCLVNFRHDAHRTSKWDFMRVIRDGALDINATGQAHLKKKKGTVVL